MLEIFVENIIKLQLRITHDKLKTRSATVEVDHSYRFDEMYVKWYLEKNATKAVLRFFDF